MSAVLLLVSGARPGTEAGRDPVGGLPAFFRTGGALQDRNGDGVVDFVSARLVLGAAPADDEVAAAGDVAARLGFETSAMNLPIPAGAGAPGVPIVVGAAGLAAAGIAASEVGAAALGPGEGEVAVVSGSSPGILVTGGDGAGTRAAAEALAGRLPYVWAPKGDTLEKVADDVRAALADAKVAVQAAEVPAVYVKAGADALERLVVHVTLAGAADVKAAQAALEGLRPRPARRGAPPPPAQAAPPKLSYPGALAVEVRLTAAGAPAATVILPRVTPPPPRDEPLPRRPGSAAKGSLDLANLYADAGLLGDSDNNLIPDRVDALLSANGPGTEGIVDLAARLGLESTGISVPLVVPPSAIGKPASEPTLVVAGVSHPIIDQLVKEKKLDRPALAAGEGLIEVVRKAFGEKSALVITGGDARGVARALTQIAERLPHIWARGKDRTTLEDVEQDVHDVIGGRSPAGQTAIALYKLDRIASTDLAGKDLASAHVKVAVEKAPDGLAAVVQQAAAAAIKAPDVSVSVEDLDVQKAKSIIDDQFDVPSEVDDFWQAFRAKVLPAVKKNKRKPVELEARLSESPEIRDQIARQARAELVQAGAPETGTSVTVLCAYKQGYSWLNDVVKPQLAGKSVQHITIRFAKIGPPPEWKQQAMYAPTRWLMEIYPIDEVLARDLKIDLSAISFEEAPIGSAPYEVTATGPGGAALFHGTFAPKFVVRQFYDQFPDYEKVRVTTGWITAAVGGKTAVDERIETDPERFWDHFQGKTLPAIYSYIVTLGDGKPRPEDAPFFGELKVDLSLSEPDYQIGIDQEQISPLESMHEEIYFNMLQFFDVLGRYTRGAPLAYPGRIIPIMHPKNDGRPGHAHITFTGFDSPRPEVVVTYKTRDGQEGKAQRDIPKAAVERPEALAALVRDGQDGIARLDLRVKVDTDQDERPTLITETRADMVDREIMSAAEVKAIVENLARLRAAGLYRDALAYHDLGEIRIAANWTFDGGAGTQRVADLAPNGSPAPFPDIRALLPAGYRYDGTPIVQWDEPMPPREAYTVLAKMSTFKEATVYKVGHSYLGQDIWAMDLMPPVEAAYWSQAKATTLKPTIIYSARQHANEVSSTSHTLKLAELLLTDPAWRKKLDRVNVVFHPITNADGAQLAYDLQKITPHFMLHAGYLGSLGVDVVAGQWDPNAIYPESRVRTELWRTWLPDIFLNPHGYPSHEWVQLFSEYAAWIRSRIGESRDYWSPRGWWMPGFDFVDDPKYPRNKEAQLALRTFIAQRINAVPPVKALDDRAYARYKRYTFDWDKDLFKLNFTDGVLIYSAIKGAKGSPTGRSFMTRQPNVTIFEGVTEAPDETAHGDWMKLVATAGLTWDEANLDYLVQSQYKVERQGSEFYGGVSLSETRPRPPKKPDEGKKAEEGGH